ncbi:hypothetical protein N7451_006702 [Penicillium sp. IBT 35674x]|nr:hypothetical protein N7451_006702 [Penicillium sp. IBT 35674x]
MTSSFKNITIVGASGSIDNILLDGLFASSQFNITVVSRLSPKKLKALFPQNVAFLKSNIEGRSSGCFQESRSRDLDCRTHGVQRA